jgi:predicted lipoprotein with Yx(FWY)xxD motif
MARRLVITALLATAFAAAAVAAAGTGVTVKSAKSSSLGATLVVSATGHTLYHTNVERKNTVKCTGACSSTWPPLLVKAGAKPVAGPGLNASKLGTVKRPDGTMQVTYGGYALYLYAGDSKAGDVNGQGTAGLWHAVSSTGTIVTKAPAAAGGAGTPAGATTTTTDTSGGYGGGGY